MINVIVIKGGLGNQMFCYAFFRAIKHNNFFNIHLLEIEPSVNRHNGLEIFKIFRASGMWRSKMYSFCFKYLKTWIQSFETVVQKNSIEYSPCLIKKKGKTTRYDGYWQSELYFKNIDNNIRREFRFRTNLTNTFTKKCATKMSHEESVSIHIRRGDYLKEDDWNISNTDYYSNAIAHINKIISTPSYYIFSDDIEWCRDRFKGSQYHFVDWNKGSDSWQDMYLMSCCKHNIIANSTFSWWGAWLNNNESKIVIAPEVWFPNIKSSDIIPHDWITISIK